MNRAAALADRFQEIRAAARGWERAGAIGATARAAIESRFPDDRVRLGPALRALAFLFTLLGMFFLVGFVGFTVSLGDEALGPFLLFCGAVFVAATEWQIGPLRRAQGGTETATAVAGIACLAAGSLWWLDRAAHLPSSRFETAAWSVAGLFLAAAAWRWGGVLFALGAAVCPFGLAMQTGHARLLLAMGGLVLLAMGLAGETSMRLCPDHRNCAKALQVVAAFALYVAVHILSWDMGILESFRTQGHPAPALRPVFIVATALLPMGLLALAVAWRRRLLLALGVLTLVASLATIRLYFHVAPPWVVLTFAGVACLGLARLLERWLARGPERQRGGFTADPLFDDERRQRVLEVAVTAAQAGSPVPARSEPDAFKGGGGDSGGGGATTSF